MSPPGPRCTASRRPRSRPVFLGAYTTFSTYAFEAVELTDRNRSFAASCYLVGTIVLTSSAAGLGLAIAN